MLECEPSWTWKEHGRVDREHEEMYVLVDGAATVTVNGEDVTIERGDPHRFPPKARHQIENGDTGSLFDLTGARYG